MESVLYQKIGLSVSRLAQDLMSRTEGERIPSVSEYQEKLQVSRGTVQNSFKYLKDMGAVSLVSRGYMGTYIEKLDYRKLQECSFNKGILGSMTLPYSLSYQGLATALGKALSALDVNLVYTRGSGNRLRLVEDGICQFSVCSRHAAEKYIKDRMDIEVAVDLGPGTYLSRHVLILRDSSQNGITEGMRVAYDRTSMDQQDITERLTKGIKGIRFVDMKSHQTINAIQAGTIDAGIWNMDEIIESGYTGLNIVPLGDAVDEAEFSSAVLVIRKGEENLKRLLQRYVDPEYIRDIQNAVKDGSIPADY